MHTDEEFQKHKTHIHNITTEKHNKMVVDQDNFFAIAWISAQSEEADNYYTLSGICLSYEGTRNITIAFFDESMRERVIAIWQTFHPESVKIMSDPEPSDSITSAPKVI